MCLNCDRDRLSPVPRRCDGWQWPLCRYHMAYRDVRDIRMCHRLPAHPESCDMGIPWPCLYEAPQRLLRQGQGLTERCFFMSCLFAVLWHSVPFALLECAPSVCQLSAVRMSCLAPNDPFRIIEKDFVASGFRRLYDQIFSNLYLARIVPLRGGIYVTCQLYTKSLREL